MACARHRHVDELGGQRLELLSIGDRRFQSRGLLGGNPTADIAAILPGLMLEVGAATLARRGVPVLGFEAALFHDVQGGHLLKDPGSFEEKIVVHAQNCLANRQFSRKNITITSRLRFLSHARLFDTNGVELAASDDTTGPGEMSGTDSYLEYTFTNGGTFYVGISGFNNTNYNAITGAGDVSGSSGSYMLVVSPGLAGTIRRPGDTTDYLVDILGFGANPMVINTNQRTWIVIHGWNSSRTADNIFAVASALFETRPGDQVLTLDWFAAANVLLPFAAEDSIVPVAQWAASALVRYGFSRTNLNLVGHSFGSYVADEIAQRIPGGVNTIVTLDPAADVLGGYDPVANDEVNFARDSFFSWSFHSSSAGNEYTPATADESFIVNSGATTPDAHGNVLFLFAYFLLHPTDIVSQYFLLTDLLNGTLGPWLPNQFVSSFAGDDPVQGYEAVIGTTNNGLEPSTLTYVPFPSLSITKATNNVSIAWHAYYTNFILQTSTTASQPASWTNITAQPVVVGQSNFVVFPASESKRFFRLRSL